MIDETEWSRLARYLAGECSPEEAAEMRSWIEGIPERADRFAVLRKVWVESGQRAQAVAGVERFDIESAWQDVTSRKRSREQGRRHRSTVPRDRVGLRHALLRVAAAIALFGGGMLAWQEWGGNQSAQATLREFSAAHGRRAELRLDDGTRIVLAAGSKLRIGEQFGRRQREVFLNGEAYFKVTHDERRPFLVHAAGATVEDLGTEFSVRAYPEDTDIQVVVAEGKVEFSGAARFVDHPAVVLTPGQLGRMSPAASYIEIYEVDPAVYLAWADGRLLFDNTPLSQVLPQLERWFEVKFRLADSSLAARPLTASFEHESLDQVLSVIAPSLDLQIHRDGNTITFAPRQ